MLSQLIDRIRAAGNSNSVATTPAPTLALAAAALLLEVANADRNVSASELAKVRQTIHNYFKLDEETLESLLDESQTTVEDSVGVQPLTRTLTEHWSEPQRFELVVALWRVALADQNVDPLEEHRIRAISDLLYVNHKRFIEAKLKAKREASV